MKMAYGYAMVQFLERFMRNSVCRLWAWSQLSCCSADVAPYLLGAWSVSGGRWRLFLSEAPVPCLVTSPRLITCLGAVQNAQLVPPWHDPPIPWVLHWEAVSSLYITCLSMDSYISQ